MFPSVPSSTVQTGHNFSASQNHIHWSTKSNHMQGWDRATTRYNPPTKWLLWRESFPNCCESSPIESILAHLQYLGSFCFSALIVINIRAFTWTFLNKTESPISQQQPSQPFICINVLNTLNTLLHNAVINYARIRVLQWNCFRNKRLRSLVSFLQKPDLLPCSSEMGCYVYMNSRWVLRWHFLSLLWLEKNGVNVSIWPLIETMKQKQLDIILQSDITVSHHWPGEPGTEQHLIRY